MTGPQGKKGKSIQSRLVMLLLLILIPVVAIQAYIYYDDYQARRALEFQANLEVARAVAKTFESFVQDVIHHELLIGLAITSPQPTASEGITRLLVSSPGYVAVRDFTWLNPKGDAIYSGNPAVVGNSYSDRSFFREIANGREWTVGELVISKATGKPVFGISRGIRDEKGNLLGVVVAMIIPQNLDTRLAIERGKGGGHALVDSKGMLVYRYPAINPTWEERNWLKQYPEYEEVFKGQEITKTVYAAYEKKNRLVSFTPVPFIGWAATAGKPEEDVVQPILISIAKSALLFLSVSFAAFFIALAVSRKIAGPVTELSAHALALGHGERPRQITLDDILEFQNLAEAFNAMAEKVQARETALRESERRWAVTLASIGDAVIATDTGGRITFLNKVAELLTGWSMADAAGKPVQEVFRIVNEHTRAIVEDPVSKVIQTGMIVGLANHTVLLRKGGDEIPIDDSGAPLRDEEGRILGVVLTFRDITERKRAEKSLRQANEGLERRVHERTAELQERADQLGRLSSQLTMAEQRERKRLAQILHDGLQQYLVAAKIQVGGLIELSPDAALKQAAAEVEDLLNESVKVSRSLAAELSPPILHEAGLLAGLEWLSRWKYKKHGLKVQLSIHMDAPVLTEDVKILLFESIRELLLNVVKHAKTDSARVSLFQQDERSLQIIVSDNGVGFDPASESVNDGNFGLFSIRERLSLIGGRLEVDSSPGKGARFTLTAPLFIDKPLESMPCAQPDEIDHIDVDPMIRSDGKIRILLTDDHAIMREGLARLLDQETDFEVVGQASDGQEAVELAGKLLPDVILMDISMPRMSGLDATLAIHQRHSDIRIIGLSLYEEEERAKAMLDAGAVFYLTKSGPPAELKAAIRSCMKEKLQAGTENAESPPLKT
jgi:PAS domain S-box-containing protein